MSSFLVTGVAGFTRSPIVEYVVAHGESVHVLDNFSTGSHSSSVHGNQESGHKHEDLQLNPHSPYAATKAVREAFS